MSQLSNVDRSDIAFPVLATSMALNQQSSSANLLSTRDDLYSPNIARVSSSSQRVLLAEDNDDLREIMSIFLRHEGYSVLACCDAQQASELFRSDPLTDTLVTDLEMPGRSGLELARELTTLRPSLRVVILSGAYITSEMSSEMKERDWVYLSKPCGLAIILQVLHGKELQSGAVPLPNSETTWSGV